jgi:predicted XRE-type DNA-binding protein
MMKKVEKIHKSSGNVFEDLGFDKDEAENLKIRATLMAAISEWIHQKRIKQTNAAKILGISQPRVSDLVNGKIEKFTIDMLVNMVMKTEQRIEMHIKAA